MPYSKDMVDVMLLAFGPSGHTPPFKLYPAQQVFVNGQRIRFSGGKPPVSTFNFVDIPFESVNDDLHNINTCTDPECLC